MDADNLDSIIHIDHAYASNENFIEEDPLKLPECEVLIKTEIKDEDIEIKIEEPDSYEEQNEPLHFEPCDNAYYDLDAVHDNANIEFVNHTTFEPENFPSVLYLDNERNRTEISSSTDKLLKENKQLKRTIATLKREKLNSKAKIESKSKKFSNDLSKMHKFQCTLQQELNRLKEENETYKTELLCYKKLKKHYLDLETNILELRRQAHRFTKYEKLSVENIKTMKADIDTKSNETKALKNRILAAVKRLSQLKAKFINLVNANKVHSLKAAQYINLQKRLTSSMNLNKVYKVHLQTCKTDFEKQIKEKQQQLHIANAELDSLREINKKKDVTCLALKNKLKFSMEQQKKKIEECNDAVASTREKMMKNNELLTLKHAENIGLKKKIIKLEKELSHLKNKGCDYCGL